MYDDEGFPAPWAWDPFPGDTLAPPATPSEAHAEWHRNAGVPMGQPGCPQDACHPDPYAEWDPRAEDTEADPEDYAELDALLADEAADPWLDPDGFDPPF
jgi:hypothetical protein